MQIKNLILQKKEVILKCLKTAGCIAALGILLGMCMLVLTVIPCDFNLIKLLLFDIRIVALNTWPLICVMAIIYFITNRLWISFSVVSAVSFVIAEVNRFKLYYRDDPFIFEDIVLFGEAREMLENYALFLDKASLCAIVFIAAAAVLSFIFVKTKIINKYVRIAGALVMSALLALSCNLLYFNNYDVFISLWHPEFGNQLKDASNSMSRGVIYSFISSIPNALPTPPEGYDRETAEDILAEYESIPMQEDKKVNIISIMLEAYNDFSQFEGVEFNKDPYENFHALRENSYRGKLYTNIFAGDTIQTERSFLTGFGGTNFYQKTDSHVSYLKEQGYYTEAMHPCYGWFYNRRNINNYLGFDNFDYLENKYGDIPTSQLREEKYLDILSDADFFDYIIEGYEKAMKKGQKYFNFSVTYQNHGPYSEEKIADTEYLVRKEEYTEKEYNIFNNYLNGIYRTDTAIGRLKEYIDNQPEPMVLILFGDHNPLLGEGNSVYNMLGIDLDLDDEESAENYYQTLYVFYANEAAKKSLKKDFNEEGSTISPMFLMNEFFEYIGIQGSAYLNYLQDIKEEYSVINPIYLKKNDRYILRSDAKNDEILTKRQWVEYYLKTEE